MPKSKSSFMGNLEWLPVEEDHAAGVEASPGKE